MRVDAGCARNTNSKMAAGFSVRVDAGLVVCERFLVLLIFPSKE